MSNTVQVTQPNTSYTMDDTNFEVQSGASLNLTGSSDQVVLDNGAGALSISGNNDTVTAAGGAKIGLNGGSGNSVYSGDDSSISDWSNANNTLSAGNYSTVQVGATGDTVTVGGNSSVEDTLWGNGANITVGANSNVSICGTNITVNATQGGGSIIERRDAYAMGSNSATLNASNYQIDLEEGMTTVAGNGNHITLNDDGGCNLGTPTTLDLTGSNNTISFNANNATGGAITIQTANGDLVQQDTTGAIWFSSAGFSLSGGVATLRFSDGNVVQITNVRSSTQGSVLQSDNQTAQLVSAMASYSNGASSDASSSPTVEAPGQSSLFASAHA